MTKILEKQGQGEKEKAGAQSMVGLDGKSERDLGVSQPRKPVGNVGSKIFCRERAGKRDKRPGKDSGHSLGQNGFGKGPGCDEKDKGPENTDDLISQNRGDGEKTQQFAGKEIIDVEK